MAQIFPGRYTADVEGDFVVFLIGMRINRLLKVRKWWPVFTAMRPMLKAHETPGLGVLDTRQAILSPRDAADHPDLAQLRPARALRARGHAPHRAVEDLLQGRRRGSGDVGIWHETFQVARRGVRVLYGNMPRFGLANAGEHRGLGSASRARDRMSV